SWANPFMEEPAAASNNNVSATCAVISMLWALRPRTLPANRRAPDCMISPMCVRESCSDGQSPKHTRSERDRHAEKQDREIDASHGVGGERSLWHQTQRQYQSAVRS